MNSYFASVEQQANPRLRGKPIGVTGGDRFTRTVLSTASIEAKRRGVKTGMQIWEAKKICPEIIIVQSDHDKYLSVTTKFLNIFKDYTDKLEVFSIDEAFLEILRLTAFPQDDNFAQAIKIALAIKDHIRKKIGEVVTCSIGISYNKLMAKLAGSLQKPDGLVVIKNQEEAIKVLDQVELDEICGIGPRTKKKLFNMGIRSFKELRLVPKDCLLASFKSYGEVLYNMARGIDNSPVKPFYEKEEVKSVSHRHTINHDISDPKEIKQILLKLCELVAARLRAKNLSGKTIHCEYRLGFHLRGGVAPAAHLGGVFSGDGMQESLARHTNDGLEVFQTAWEIFEALWNGEKIRMIGISVSNLKPTTPATISCLENVQRQQTILQAMDKINHKFGNFTLQRGSLLVPSKGQAWP